MTKNRGGNDETAPSSAHNLVMSTDPSLFHRRLAGDLREALAAKGENAAKVSENHLGIPLEVLDERSNRADLRRNRAAAGLQTGALVRGATDRTTRQWQRNEAKAVRRQRLSTKNVCCVGSGGWSDFLGRSVGSTLALSHQMI